MPLQIRIGINTGEVLAGPDPDQDLPLTADAVNTAARLEQLAQPGTILMSERTARSVEDAFVLESLGHHDIKGKSEPLAVWKVLRARSRVATDTTRAPLIGRARELQELDDWLRAAIGDRRARIVTLLGDPGVGKTRLISEFSRAVAGECHVVSGRCPGYGEGATLAPLAEIVRDESGIVLEDSLDDARAKIHAFALRVVGDGPGSERVVTGLMATLGLDAGVNGDSSALELYEDLLFSWCALLTALTTERPVVVVIEDVHWADAVLLDVLAALESQIASAVLFLCTARPEFAKEHADWPPVARGSLLRVKPLTDDETAELVDTLLGVTSLPSFRDRILRHAEGNPFFVEQITRRVLDEGNALGGQAEELAEFVIPDNVQSVILSRIDLLAPPARRVLQEASVVGRSFRVGTLSALSDDPEARRYLEELELRELIVRSDHAGEPEYAFKHALVRDVAYRTLPKKVRAAMHERVARWLERRSGTRSDEYAEVVAHHFHRAFEITRDPVVRSEARGAYLRAVQNAQRGFALREARRMGSAAIELSNDGLDKVEAMEALGDAYFITSQGDSAWKVLCDAVAELDRAGVARPDIEARLVAKASLLATRFAGALQEEIPEDQLSSLISRGLRAAPPGDSRERCMLLMSKAALDTFDDGRSSPEAVAASEEAVAIAERLDDADLISASLDIASVFRLVEGGFREMRLHQERRLALGRTTDPRELGDASGGAAWASYNSGDFEAAEEYATRCMEVARGRDPGIYVHGLAWRICALLMLGLWDELLKDQAELDQLNAEDDRDLPVPYTLRAYAATALCHQLRANRDAAIPYVSILEKARHEGIQRGGFEPTLARVYAHQGKFEQAFSLIAVEQGGHSGSPDEVRAQRLEALGDLILLAQRWDLAPETVEHARAEAARVQCLSLPAFADRLEGASAWMNGDHQKGQQMLLRSAATFEELGARWHAAWSRLWLGRFLSERGLPGDRSLLEDAGRTFAAMGSVTEAYAADRFLNGAATGN